jgi:hypothetical protein
MAEYDGLYRDDSDVDECSCTPTKLCDSCEAKGYQNSLAGYAARIWPQHVTEQEMKNYDDAESKRYSDSIGARYQP